MGSKHFLADLMMLLLLLVFLLDVGTEVLGIIHSFNKRFSVFISVVVSFGKCVTAVYFCGKVLSYLPIFICQSELSKYSFSVLHNLGPDHVQLNCSLYDGEMLT